jgi:hypothetical protein
MSTSAGDSPRLWLAGVFLALLVIAGMGWRMLRTPHRLSAGGGPAAVSDLNALIPYASTPLPSVNPTEFRRVVVASRDPFRTVQMAPLVAQSGDQPTTRGKATAEDVWDVSAILITESRRAAVINDMLVTIGGPLPGGSHLTAVERDHVVVTDSKGERRTININRGNQ